MSGVPSAASPIPLPKSLLPYPGWRPVARETAPTLPGLMRRETLAQSGRQVDDPAGCNNFWSATTELGSAWRNSRLKWKWRSKLGEATHLLQDALGKDWREDQEGADSAANRADQEAMAKKLRRPIQSINLVKENVASGSEKSRVSVSAARTRTSQEDKTQGLGPPLTEGQKKRPNFDTWVVESEQGDEQEGDPQEKGGQENSDVFRCFGDTDQEDSPPNLAPPVKKARFGIFQAGGPPRNDSGTVPEQGARNNLAEEATVPRRQPSFGLSRPASAGAAPKFGINRNTGVAPAAQTIPPGGGGNDQGQDSLDSSGKAGGGVFRTASEKLVEDYLQRFGGGRPSVASYGTSTKTLGASRPASSAFRPPIANKEDGGSDGDSSKNARTTPAPAQSSTGEEVTDERLKNVDPKMVELIRSEIMDAGASLHWDDIAGLEFVKGVIKEIVVFPMLRPDIFKGLKSPPKGLLLFGPPGTGKTLIGKCIASQSKSTFFAISASSLTSKWVGEGEKMVRALFAVARVHQPSVVFIDEIDSLLTARSDNEHESSRRLKTEFLVQLDGATTEGDERILVVGATNRPQDLDEAARRRLVKRLYVPLPEDSARGQIITHLLKNERHKLQQGDVSIIVAKTEGYSGADMANLCRDAALGPVRSLDYSAIETISKEDIRPVMLRDFEDALRQVKASVSDQDLDMYRDWDSRYGSGK